MHKTDGGGNDARGVSPALSDQVAEFHQGRGGIAEGEEGIRMLLHGQADACLAACDAKRRGHLGHARIAEVALGLDAQTLECAFSDAARHHRHVGHDGLQLARFHLIEYSLYSPFVCIEDILHVEVGSGVDGVQQSPLVVEGVVVAAQFALDGAERLHHDLLSTIHSQLSTLHSQLSTIIPPWRDDLPFGDIRL